MDPAPHGLILIDIVKTAIASPIVVIDAVVATRAQVCRLEPQYSGMLRTVPMYAGLGGVVMRWIIMLFVLILTQTPVFSATSVDEQYEDEKQKLSDIEYSKSVINAGVTYKAPDGFKLNTMQCGDEDFECLYYQASTIISVPFAYKGAYHAQKALASCLADGCSKALIPNQNLSCAWRVIILASAHAEIDETDDWLFEGCFKRLTASGHSTAKGRAIKMFKLIYGRSIAKDWQ